MSPRRKSGFTLIELLVVIAIIAILAAILFPVFARAREAARKSNCGNNMKEIAISLQTYWTDYDATLPSSAVTWRALNPTSTAAPTWSAANFEMFATVLGQVPVPTNIAPRTWVQMLYNHMKSKDIMFCPSDSEDHYTSSAKVSYYWKYAVDAAWWGPLPPDNGKCQKEADFGFNADQVVFYERAGFHDNKSQGLQNGVKINVAFLDTHVRNVSLVNSSGTIVATGPGGVSYANGEPWYFNYNQELPKGSTNPPPAETVTTYVDPRIYSDLLP